MEKPKYAAVKQLAHLTGFRAIAAYLVLIAHSIDTAFSGVLHAHIACLAYLGMSIFFVLSGFVITYTYYDRFIALPWRQATKDFFVARFARLYPLYILFLCESHQRGPLLHRGTLAEKASYLTLTQCWWNMQSLTFAPAWSISTECFFYLCFALWMLFPTKSGATEKSIRIKVYIVLASFLLFLEAMFAFRFDLMTLLSPLSHTATKQDIWGWFQYYSPYVRIGEFIAGACAARMVMVTRHEPSLPTHQHRSSILCLGSVAAIFIMMIGNAAWFPSDSFLFFLSLNFGYAPFLSYLLYACSRYPNLLTRWCSTRPMQIGGEISYSVYILQFLVYSRVFLDMAAPSSPILAYEISTLKLFTYMFLTTAISLLSYHLVEMPSRRFLRKWL